MDGSQLADLGTLPRKSDPTIVPLHGRRWSITGRHNGVELTVRAWGDKTIAHLAATFDPDEARAIGAALIALANEVSPPPAEG